MYAALFLFVFSSPFSAMMTRRGVVGFRFVSRQVFAGYFLIEFCPVPYAGESFLRLCEQFFT